VRFEFEAPLHFPLSLVLAVVFFLEGIWGLWDGMKSELGFVGCWGLVAFVAGCW